MKRLMLGTVFATVLAGNSVEAMGRWFGWGRAAATPVAASATPAEAPERAKLAARIEEMNLIQQFKDRLALYGVELKDATAAQMQDFINHNQNDHSATAAAGSAVSLPVARLSDEAIAQVSNLLVLYSCSTTEMMRGSKRLGDVVKSLFKNDLDSVTVRHLINGIKNIIASDDETKEDLDLLLQILLRMGKKSLGDITQLKGKIKIDAFITELGWDKRYVNMIDVARVFAAQVKQMNGIEGFKEAFDKAGVVVEQTSRPVPASSETAAAVEDAEQVELQCQARLCKDHAMHKPLKSVLQTLLNGFNEWCTNGQPELAEKKRIDGEAAFAYYCRVINGGHVYKLEDVKQAIGK